MASQNWLVLFSLTRLNFVLKKNIDIDRELVSFNQCSLWDCVTLLDPYNLCHPEIGTLNLSCYVKYHSRANRREPRVLFMRVYITF